MTMARRRSVWIRTTSAWRAAAAVPAGVCDRIEEGSKVEANYRGRGRYYPGRVSRVRLNGTMDIDYDDGEKEIGVDKDNVRLAGGSGSPAGVPVIASRRAPRSRRTTAGEAGTTLAVCHACV